MPNEPTTPNWRERLALTVVRGVVSGAVRALITWLLEY
jgi:hypothetical protein